MANKGNGKTGRRNNTITLSEIPGQLPEELTHQAKLRRVVHKCVTEADVETVVSQIVARAKKGEPAAVKQFMDYLLGEKTPITLVQNNFQGAGHAALDDAIDAPPGSPAKIEQMQRRVASRLPACINGDAN